MVDVNPTLSVVLNIKNEHIKQFNKKDEIVRLVLPKKPMIQLYALCKR